MILAHAKSDFCVTAHLVFAPWRVPDDVDFGLFHFWQFAECSFHLFDNLRPHRAAHGCECHLDTGFAIFVEMYTVHKSKVHNVYAKLSVDYVLKRTHHAFFHLFIHQYHSFLEYISLLLFYERLTMSIQLMHKHLICLDLDGTLLTHEKKISPYTKKVLMHLKEMGHEIMISTGRPYRASEPYYRELEMSTPVVNFNGAF